MKISMELCILKKNENCLKLESKIKKLKKMNLKGISIKELSQKSEKFFYIKKKILWSNTK